MAQLTGREAAAVLGVYARLGAAGARFNAAKVARAVQTRAGRLRVVAAIRNAVRPEQKPKPRPARARTKTAAARPRGKSKQPDRLDAPGRPGG